MCGLIGGSGKLDARAVIALGCLSEKRGSDSAGIAWQVADKLRVAKIAQNPLVAFPMTLAPAIRHAAKYGGALIGHTRAATTGAVTDANAHPFLEKESRISWAHNGVITNYAEFGTFTVDSQSLIQGIKERDFKKYHGPVALLWIEEGKLHAFRKGNPLYRGLRKDAVYLASEQSMLAEVGCKKIKELSEGILYVFSADKVESSKAIPYNKSYSSRSHYPLYDGHDGWESWRGERGGYYDETLRKWVSYGDHSSEVHGADKRIGFGPWAKKEEKEVHGDVSLIPEKVQDVLELDGAGREDGLARGYADKMEADSLAEYDAEILDMETLCTECRVHRKSGESPFCSGCIRNRWMDQR